jgi:hypothetical protein
MQSTFCFTENISSTEGKQDGRHLSNNRHVCLEDNLEQGEKKKNWKSYNIK